MCLGNEDLATEQGVFVGDILGLHQGLLTILQHLCELLHLHVAAANVVTQPRTLLSVINDVQLQNPPVSANWVSLCVTAMLQLILK